MLGETRRVDFAAPISESGDRNEIMAIKLGGGIKNPAEMMFYAMKYNGYPEWKKKYPGIETLNGMKNIERFLRCTYYTEENFLRAMRNPLPPLSYDEIKIDTGILRGEHLNLNLCSITAMEVGLHNILSQDLCKKLYIFDAFFPESAEKYIYNEYQAYKKKITLATGTLIELVEGIPEITTIIIDDIEEVVRMVEYEEVNKPDLLQGKAFFIASNCSLDINAQSSMSTTGKLAHKYDSFMESAIKKDKFQINWFNHTYVNFENPGKVIAPECIPTP